MKVGFKLISEALTFKALLNENKVAYTLDHAPKEEKYVKVFYVDDYNRALVSRLEARVRGLIP